MGQKIVRWMPVAGLVTFFFVRPAHGYVDPGTGSYVLQTALGLLFALAYALKVYWRQIRAYFQSLSAPKSGSGKSQV